MTIKGFGSGSGGGGGSGTVTSFAFTNGSGFTGTVSTATTTPTLALTTSLTQNSVPFIGASGALTEDNTNLNYDPTNHRLQVGSGDAANTGVTLGWWAVTRNAALWCTGVGTLSTTNHGIRLGDSLTEMNSPAGTGGQLFFTLNNGQKMIISGTAGIGPAITAGTATTAVSALSATQTWNNAAVTFTGFSYSATDTASAAGSFHTQWFCGSAGTTAILQLTKTGALTTPSNMTMLNMTATGAVSGGIQNVASSEHSLSPRSNSAGTNSVVAINQATAWLGPQLIFQKNGVTNLTINNDGSIASPAALSLFASTNVGFNVGGGQVFAATPTQVSFTNFSRDFSGNTMFLFTSIAAASLPTTAEILGLDINLSATQTHATGTIALQRDALIRATTHAFAAASTITTAATLTITGAPIAGANATITNAYALNVASGNSFFGGAIRPGTFTVATLPAAPSTGSIAVVTDQLTTPNAKGIAPTGGGAVVCAQIYTGSGWVGI